MISVIPQYRAMPRSLLHRKVEKLRTHGQEEKNRIFAQAKHVPKQCGFGADFNLTTIIALGKMHFQNCLYSMYSTFFAFYIKFWIKNFII